MEKAKAAKILLEEYDTLSCRRMLCNKPDDIDYLNDFLIALLTAIDALEQDNGWINIKDRKPEPETWALVYIKYPSPVFELERGIQKTSSVKKMFYDGESFYCDFGAITHWQPLPEPPKEG